MTSLLPAAVNTRTQIIREKIRNHDTRFSAQRKRATFNINNQLTTSKRRNRFFNFLKIVHNNAKRILRRIFFGSLKSKN